MKIKHILAVIILSGSTLMFTPQQAKAGSFYFHIDIGSHLYSFYPYRHDLWPVYGYHHFSSPFYFTHLHYYFPLISYYHPVYYYPLVPHRFARLHYSPGFYHHVYAYYRHRPYVHNRYYHNKSRIYAHRRQHYTYYEPSRYHKSHRSIPDYSHRDNKRRLYFHERNHVKKRHFTDRDFRHLHRIDKEKKHSGRKHLRNDHKRDHKTIKQKGNFRHKKHPADIADRLIHRNKHTQDRRKHLHKHRDHRQFHGTHGKRKHSRLDNKRRQFPHAGTSSGKRRQFAGPSPRSFINDGAGKKHKRNVRSYFDNRQHKNHRHDIHKKSGRSDGGFKRNMKRKWKERSSSAGRSLSRHKGHHSGKRSKLRMQR